MSLAQNQNLNNFMGTNLNFATGSPSTDAISRDGTSFNDENSNFNSTTDA